MKLLGTPEHSLQSTLGPNAFSLDITVQAKPLAFPVRTGQTGRLHIVFASVWDHISFFF